MVITTKNQSHNNKKEKRLLERFAKRNEIENAIISELKKENDLTIAELVDKLGLSRGNFMHYLKAIKDRGLIIQKRQEDIQGRPVFLRLNKKRLKERERHSTKNWKSFEEFNLKHILSMKIIEEIERKQSSGEQHKRLLSLMKRFKKEGFGSKIIFLLYSDLIKIDYKLSLTDKGKKAFKKFKPKKKQNVKI
jgi:DNA-binding MarR family transcriptional regulator